LRKSFLFLFILFVLLAKLVFPQEYDFSNFAFTQPRELDYNSAILAPFENAYYDFAWNFYFNIPKGARDMVFRFPIVKDDIYQKVVRFYSVPDIKEEFFDEEANKLGIFELGNFSENKEVKVEIGYIVECNLKEKKIFYKDIGPNYTKIDAPLLIRYLFNKEPVDDYVQKLSQKITLSEKSPLKKAYLIYNFLIKNMHYRSDYSNKDQRPLQEVLNSKEANCFDLARVYVALCQASGIACRQVNGVVFGPAVFFSKDVYRFGHSWVEIYLPGIGWVLSDPTFGLVRGNDFFLFYSSKRLIQSYGSSISAIAGVLSYNADSPLIIKKEQKIIFDILGENE